MTGAVAVSGGTRRVVPLRAGRTLVVRPATPADAAALLDLYSDLSVDDRYLRFFSAGPSLERFVEGWVRNEERGGLVLVAVLHEADGAERIVADAGYTPLPDGDGELGMTVASGWRGWLGPYLLDALLEDAAARSIPNLEADVLAENTPMRRLLAARGSGLLEQEDVTSVRIIVGTAGRTPVWPGLHRDPRVLVEGADAAAEQVARDLGYHVVTCPGPGAGRPPCPLLEGAPCPLVEGADAVVCALRDPEEGVDGVPAGVGELVRRAHQRLHPEVPVLVRPRAGAAQDGLAVALRAVAERGRADPPASPA